LTTPHEYLFQEDLYSIPASVVVVLAQPWHNILEADKALLAKILGSVKINIDSVVVTTQEQVSLNSLMRLKAEKVLVFGGNGLTEIKLYENVNANGMQIIKADALHALTDVTKKSLWMALKQMFAV
jgi:hypothetical protein